MSRLLQRIFRRGTYSNENLAFAADFVTGRDIEGDYLEFGVYRGDSFRYAYRLLTDNREALGAYARQHGLEVPKTLQSSIRFFAFDSFAGLPALTGGDATRKAPSHWREGQFAASKDTFLANLRSGGVDLGAVTLVEGWYNQTLVSETKRSLSLKQGAIFHIDCDLYESTILVLEFITDLWVDGSIVIFDDWFGFRGNPRYGEQRAFREWRERYSIEASEFWRCDGRSVAFILHGKE